MLDITTKPLQILMQRQRTIINQKKILAAAKSKNIVFLKPVPPKFCGGHIEHYYHFIFDLVLPLNLLIQNTKTSTTFAIEPFGVFTERLQNLFPGRICFTNESTIDNDAIKIPLLGMNPKCVYLTQKELSTFANDVLVNLDIKQPDICNNILLIERSTPNSYYLENATKKGGGSTRRSISNHNEFRTKIQTMVKTPYKFHNLQLENMPFYNQLDYFSKAQIVLGQHGAGLANCIWMKPKSTVIEISNNESLDHFRVISKLKNHDYHLFKTNGPHTTIDTNKFIDWLLSIEKFRDYFDTSNTH